MPKKASYLPRGQRVMNAIFGTMVRFGMIPGAHLMSVPGRKSGKMQTIPLYVLRHERERWLVAGYAGSDWVKNLRVAGWCEFFHDRVKERYRLAKWRIWKFEPLCCESLYGKPPARTEGMQFARMRRLKNMLPLCQIILFSAWWRR